MALPVLHPVTERTVFAHNADISTASSCFTVAVCRGRIVKLGSAISVAITTADGVITTEINGTAVTGGGWSITQSGSAAGDVDTVIPTAANWVNEGDTIEFVSSGACDTTCPTTFFAVIEAE